MPLNFGGTHPIQALKLADIDFQKLCLGSTILWSKSSIRISFDGPDAATLGVDWVDYGPSSTYKAGIVNGQCRLAIPDGLISLPLLTSRQRYNAAQAPNTDYELEFRVGSQGSGPSITGDLSKTQVFARVSNTAFTHGVGVQLDSSTLRIVRRVSNTDTIMLNNGGTFAAGDTINLKGVGNLHTLRRNGSRVGEWPDTTGTAASGPGYKSLGVVVMGSKDLLGPRRFGPTIDWVELN
ncbi:DUF7257 domain-containing protein [Mycolicibacterium conceptionense]|uniref:DUF7257 domain-containing protein n=1 Tax=Mycolicibacterium conceptionense TaxID=451644 RepID=UPI00096DF779|nr:hypothetical protein [Mycolicibacterium conceptionense]OMB79300.1 hypothetical protein A5743_14475 [Mycolicibacterium conceptionense]